MMSLDVSSNNLGQLVPPSTLPAGWEGPDDYGYYDGPNGEGTETLPGSMPLGIITFANDILDMGALSVLNLASNNLGEIVLAAGWRSKDNEDMAPWVGPEGQEQREKPGKPEGIITIANAIKDNGALTKLILKDNRLATAEAGKILSDMLAANTVLKELDVSSNCWDVEFVWDQAGGNGPDFAREISKGLSDNGALIKLDISSNAIGAAQEGDLQHIYVASGIELAK
jgi:hypothetical protein